MKSCQCLLLLSYPLSNRKISVLRWSGSGCGSQRLKPPCATCKSSFSEDGKKKKEKKSHNVFFAVSHFCFFVRSIIEGLCHCPRCYLSLLWLLSSHHVVPQDLLWPPAAQALNAWPKPSPNSLRIWEEHPEGFIAGCAAFVSMVLHPIAGIRWLL